VQGTLQLALGTDAGDLQSPDAASQSQQMLEAGVVSQQGPESGDASQQGPEFGDASQQGPESDACQLMTLHADSDDDVDQVLLAGRFGCV